MSNEFLKFTLTANENLFLALQESVNFEKTGKGRLGSHIVKTKQLANGKTGMPIVRTTTNFTQPANHFHKIHEKLVSSIQQHTDIKTDFNNALIEIYNQQYRKMAYHSDQCMDIAKPSYIAIFSCYKNPETLTEHHLRKLKVKHKASQKLLSIDLNHNSIVLFSTQTNAKYVHNIVLDPIKGKQPEEDNPWLGITFRQSNAFVFFEAGKPYFENGNTLTLANADERNAFFKLKAEENTHDDFNYPDVFYTFSLADTLPPA